MAGDWEPEQAGIWHGQRRAGLLGAAALLAGRALPAQPLALTAEAELAEVWDSARSPTGFAISEKFDGVRALWDGRQLRFRSGRVLDTAPPWFLAALPALALDGELWLGYGRFAELAGRVRKRRSTDAAWQGVRYLVFDAPRLRGTFAQRHQALQAMAAGPVWRVLPQGRVADATVLQARLLQVLARGGEGLVLHRWDAPWQSGRSGAVFKFKPHADDEAEVMAYRPGQGQFAGLVGALLVRDAQGRRFALGSGLSEQQRRHPPAIGSWVSYRHQGLTVNGLPRFAVFLRERPPE